MYFDLDQPPDDGPLSEHLRKVGRPHDLITQAMWNMPVTTTITTRVCMSWLCCRSTSKTWVPPTPSGFAATYVYSCAYIHVVGVGGRSGVERSVLWRREPLKASSSAFSNY